MTATNPATRSSSVTTPSRPLGQPRPLWRVILLSGLTGMLYYGWYKWIIQEELKAYRNQGWSGTLCLAPFGLGVVVPQALRLTLDLPGWVGWLSLLGVVWIYIVQFRLYRTVNQLCSATVTARCTWRNALSRCRLQRIGSCPKGRTPLR